MMLPSFLQNILASRHRKGHYGHLSNSKGAASIYLGFNVTRIIRHTVSLRAYPAGNVGSGFQNTAPFPAFHRYWPLAQSARIEYVQL